MADDLAWSELHTVVVIGGGQAAGWIVKTLRKDGFTGRLVMIADEIHLPYERPPLSKAVLSGDADIDTVHLVSSDDFAALNVEAWQPDRALAIDRERRIVRTSRGREVRYDRLVIATGGAARRLPESLVRTSHIAYLRTLDDAVSLGARLRKSARVLVIGGGWIGLEVAATARKLGVEVTVIEGAARLCGRSLPQTVSDFLLALHRSNGVDVRLDALLVALDDHEQGVRASFADGSTLDADFAVAGIGLAPHTVLAQEVGLDVNDGIVVDEFGATSDPLIFACGDVSNHPNAWLKRRVRLESWANAQNQAIATARALMGTREPYAEIPWFWSDQYDVNLQILGDIPAGIEPVIRGDLDARRASLFFLEAGVIRGVISINMPRDLKLARKWMSQGREIDVATLADTSKRSLNPMDGIRGRGTDMRTFGNTLGNTIAAQGGASASGALTAGSIIARIERLPTNPMQVRARFLIGAATFFDGFDVITIATTLPLLIQKWGLTPGQIGFLIASGSIGQLIGAFLFPALAERFGRVRSIAWSSGIIGITSIACGFAPTFAVFVALRIAQGLGLAANCRSRQLISTRSRGHTAGDVSFCCMKLCSR